VDALLGLFLAARAARQKYEFQLAADRASTRS
jgi:hypothetical protein